MIVRDAGDDDRDAVFELSNALALERPVDRAAFDRQYRAALADDRTQLLVAVDASAVAADEAVGADGAVVADGPVAADEAAIGGDASDEGGVVGYLLGVISPMFLYNGGFAFVQELCVAADVRRRGIGAALMSEFEARAVVRGAGAVALATSRAGPFYEALGYAGGATYFKKWLAPEQG